MTGIERRRTPTVDVGGVQVGSCHPVVVQSMTNTDTADAAGTTRRCGARGAGSRARPRDGEQRRGGAGGARHRRAARRRLDVPVIGDFHYNGHLLLAKYPACARALAKYRINPGNVGAKHRDENFRDDRRVAVDHGKPVRIGVNWGSLDQDLLTEMMDENARSPSRATRATLRRRDRGERAPLRRARRGDGLGHDRIIISAKVSQVQDLVDVYRALARALRLPAAPRPHRGGAWARRASSPAPPACRSSSQEGIGDTIRVSLTPRPAATAPRRCRSRSRSSSRWASAASRRR